MKFINGWLEGVQHVKSPNKSGKLVNPTIITDHYTATGPEAIKTANYFAGRAAGVSAHFVVGEDGEIIQCVSIFERAWHAGKSIWRGRANCNDFAIGIEICNWGVLTKRADGKFWNWTGKIEIPANRVLEAKHKNGNFGAWHTYTEEALKSVAELHQGLKSALPSLKEVVGHEDIAPGRKTDPGPAYPMLKMQNLFLGDRQGTSTPDDATSDQSTNDIRTVNVASLNVRKGPGTSFGVVTTLQFGSKVNVLYDGGDWSRIEHAMGEAWVADRYLK